MPIYNSHITAADKHKYTYNTDTHTFNLTHTHHIPTLTMPVISLSRIGQKLGHGHDKSKPFKLSLHSAAPDHAHVDLQRGELQKPSSKRKPGAPRPSVESAKSAKGSLVRQPADPTMALTIESPPLVCYGSPKDSTGALLSGQMHLSVSEAAQRIESFTLLLRAQVLVRRPVHGGCADCSTQCDTLARWPLIADPVTLARGTHSYPFSHLLAGHLPASSDNALARISYSVVAVARTAAGDETTYTHPLTLSRAILPGPDKPSVRVFPPTTLSASVALPSVVHPGSTFPLSLRLDGVRNAQKNTRWRLRRATWRIDEAATAVSPACAVHSARLGGAGKGVLHEDSRTVASADVKRGWKSDFDTADGRIEIPITAALPAAPGAVACDVVSPCGIAVKHVLVVELIVAEEWQPTAVSRATTATGAARVLRMQFALNVTARSGLGISWDEEAPPRYEDVPHAPPGYGGAEQQRFRYAEFPVLEEVPAAADAVEEGSVAAVDADALEG